MKKICLIFSFFVLCGSVVSAQKTPSQQKAASVSQNSADGAIKMVKEKYDVGKIPAGDAYTFYMEFTNQTKKPLVVKHVGAGCGCTVPEKPTEPIMPGKTGKIKVVYTPASPMPINKDVEIYLAGYNEPKVVYFTGEAVAKK